MNPLNQRETTILSLFIGLALACFVPTPIVQAGDKCASGYVWREARPTDHVCVTPESRSLVSKENTGSAYPADRMAAHRKSDESRAYPGAVESRNFRPLHGTSHTRFGVSRYWRNPKNAFIEI